MLNFNDVKTLAELVRLRAEYESEFACRRTTLLQEIFVSKIVPHLTRLDVSVDETKNNFLKDMPKILFSPRRKRTLDVQRFLSNVEGKLRKLVKEHPREVCVHVTFGDEFYSDTVPNNALVNFHFTLKDSVTYEVKGLGWLEQILNNAAKRYAKDGEVFATDHAGQRYDSKSLTTPALSTNPVPLSLTVVSRQTVDRTKEMYSSLIRGLLRYSKLVANQPPLFWEELANTLGLPPCAEKCIKKVHGVEAFTENIGFGDFPVREMSPTNLQFLHSTLEWLNAVHESFGKLKVPPSERLRVVGELILQKLGGDDENDVEKPPKKVRTSE